MPDDAFGELLPPTFLGPAADLVCRFAHAWEAGPPPDVRAFLAAAGPVSPAELAEVLRVDQQCRWQRGDRVRAETYFESFPDLAAEPEYGIDLVYGEFLLRERLGEGPQPDEYARRFPQFAAGLRRQLEVYRAVEAGTPNGKVQIPGYEILGELGRGGMGVVYEARQLGLDRPVALKMVLAGAYAGPVELARLQAEAEAASRLQHPNIVPVYEVGEHDGHAFLAMALISGGTLAERLAGTPQPPDQAAALVETLARAVQHAHERGVLHRDLKPANILLQIADCGLQIERPSQARGDKSEIFDLQSAIPQISDFGLAKRLDRPGSLTPTGAVLGTPSYMAPEQAGGKEPVGPAADLYALGAILYECLTGRPPFRGETALETLRQVQTEEPAPPSRLRPKLPRDLETVCLKCLEKDPARRYRSAADLADDLCRFRDGRPIHARPTPSWERAWKWARRRPAAAALVAVGAVLAVGLLAGTAWYAEHEHRQAETERQLRGEAQRREAEARRMTYRSDMLLAWQAWERADIARVNQLLGKQAEDLRGADWRYLDHLCHADLHTWERAERIQIRCLAVSPDGATLAAGWVDGAVTLWDVRTRQELATFAEHDSLVLAVAFSPDGKTLASASGQGGVTLRPLGSDRPPLALAAHPGQVFGLAFSRDGAVLATACNDGLVRLWATATGQPAGTLGEPGLRVACLAFSPDGTVLAAGGYDRAVRLWEAAAIRPGGTPRPRATLADHADVVRCLAFHPDGTTLAVGSGDAVITLWDLAKHAPRARLRGHSDSVWTVAWSPDGKSLASASYDNTVRLWDLTADGGRERAVLRGHTNGVYGVAFLPDGKELVSGGRDGTCKLWSAAAGRSHRTLDHPGTVRAVAFAPDGRTLFTTGTPDGNIRLWDPATGRLLTTKKLHDSWIWSVVPSADGNQLVTCGQEGMVKLWRRRGQEIDFRAQGRFPGVPYAVAFLDEGRTVLATDSRGRLRLLEPAGTDLVARTTLLAHPGWVWGLAVSPDGVTAATPGFQGVVLLWDMATHASRTLRGHSEDVRCLAFAPDGGTLASGSYDTTVRLWDVRSGEQLASLEGHLHPVWALAFSPDGRLLATAGGTVNAPGEVILWDVATRQELVRLQGHAGTVYGVAFSPDGSLLATAGQDGTVKLWDVARVLARSWGM